MRKTVNFLELVNNVTKVVTECQSTTKIAIFVVWDYRDSMWALLAGPTLLPKYTSPLKCIIQWGSE